MSRTINHPRPEASLDGLTGKTVTRVDHHEALGLVEVHFTDGAVFSAQAHGKCDASVMICEPQRGGR